MRICEGCGTANDDTRAVCMQCGRRLPAPVAGSAPKMPAAGASAPQVGVFKKVTGGGIKKVKPRRSVVSNLLIFLLLPAFGLALWLAIQPDNDIPPAPPADPAADALLASSLRDASQSRPGAWSMEPDAINRFLASNIKLEPVKNALGINASFERAFAEFGSGFADFTMQVRLFERDVFFRLRMVPEKSANGLTLKPVGAWVGDLPILPALLPLVLPVFQPCADSLENIFAVTSSADSAEFSPKKIVVRWASGASPR